MEDITRSPLSWPAHKPRTKERDRKFGRFNSAGGGGYRRDITLAQATRRLFEQIRAFTRAGQPYRIVPDDVIISSNLAVRKDGLPRSGQRKPDDPGVAVYFELDGNPRCVPCDQYSEIEQNIAAIAATLEALRLIERHGSQMFEAAFSGFTALPGPDHVVVRTWREVLDYYGDDYKEMKEHYQRARSANHPDHGGSEAAFIEVQNALVAAEKELLDFEE